MTGNAFKGSIQKAPPRRFLVPESLTIMKIAEYLRETKGELKHVSWPTRRQAIAFTVLVVAISIITAIYLGLFDALFSEALKLIVS